MHTMRMSVDGALTKLPQYVKDSKEPMTRYLKKEYHMWTLTVK